MAKKGTIELYGNIGYDWWSDGGLTDKWFSKEFDRAAEEVAGTEDDPIVVRINSPGGVVSDGINMYNKIAQSKKVVHTYVDGIAYSMGAIIMLAGSKVHAARNATVLFHNCYGGAYGNANDLEQAVEMMKALDDSLAVNVADKLGVSVEDAKAKWFDYKDHTLTATKAKEEGFVDVVLEKDGTVPKDLKDMTPVQLAAFYSSLSSQGESKGFMAQLKQVVSSLIPKQDPPKGESPKPQHPKSNKMLKLKATMAALLGFFAIQGDAEEFEVEPTAEQLQDLNDRLAKLEGLEKSVKDLKAEKTQLENTMNELRDAAGAADNDELKNKLDAWGKGDGGATAPKGKKGESEEDDDDDPEAMLRSSVDDQLEAFLNPKH